MADSSGEKDWEMAGKAGGDGAQLRCDRVVRCEKHWGFWEL